MRACTTRMRCTGPPGCPAGASPRAERIRDVVRKVVEVVGQAHPPSPDAANRRERGVAAGAALALSGAAVLAGTLAFLAVVPREERASSAVDGARRDLLCALRSPGLRTLIGAMLPVGVALAFADHEGRRELAGVLLAVSSLAAPPADWRTAPARAHARSRVCT